MSIVRADFLRAVVLPSPAACRFVGADEFVAMALACYYAASRDLEPPAGEPWKWSNDEGSAYWSSPEDFATGLLHHVEQRLTRMAIDRGYAVEFVPAADGVRGLAPADMAHGCAALSPGAGAPPMPSPDPDITAPDNPLFACPKGQDLPVGESLVNTQFPREVTHAS